MLHIEVIIFKIMIEHMKKEAFISTKFNYDFLFLIE